MPRSSPHADPSPGAPDRRATGSFNSISTRIVACVFAASALTAVAVSVLCVSAIHGELAGRLGQTFSTLATERSAAWDVLRAELGAELAAAVAPDSPWSPALTAAWNADSAERLPALRWRSDVANENEAPSLDALVAGDLPIPSEALRERFDRLVLGSAETASGVGAGCLAIEIELPAEPSSRPGRLAGCVDRDLLVARLGAPADRVLKPRILVSDLRGHVLAAAGPGASTRLADLVPIPQLLGRDLGRPTRYSDAAGRALVGIAVPLGRSGWFLTVETEHARAFASAIALTRMIFMLDVCIVLLFSVLAYKVTQAIMAPIHALSSGAQRILDGQIDHQIPPPAIHDDELGLLTHTFNEMMRKLRSNQTEIDRDRVRLAEKNDELQSANEVLSQLSITDGLTKLHNHRYFQDHLTREIKRVSRTNAPLSLILIDIDDFKQLNDTHGHAAGDEVLMSLASIMNESARESDLIARYGGEEFVILMPNTDLAGAVHLAEKIRMTVESTRLIIGDRMKPTDITISLGVALFKGNRREFFAEADRALYRAKAAGKNCVIIGGPEAPALS